MDDELKEIIERVVVETMRSAAYILAERTDEGDDIAPEIQNPIGVSLTFSGTPSGSLTLWAEPRLARIAAANMLGIDEEDSAAVGKQVEALKELLNIIVGSFLTEAYGEHLLFDLGLPQQCAMSRLEEKANHPDTLWIVADESPVAISLQLHDPGGARGMTP